MCVMLRGLPFLLMEKVLPSVCPHVLGLLSFSETTPAHSDTLHCVFVSGRATGSCFLGLTFQLISHLSFFASKLILGRERRKRILLFLSFKDQVVFLLPGQQGFSPKAPKEPCSLVNTEKLKAQLLQIQTELNNSKQEYEEFKELTR